MTLITDRREPLFFRERADDVRELKYGDFLVEEGGQEVYLERKTFTDCWNSLRTKRLDRQLYDLSLVPGSVGLLLETSYVPPQAKASLHSIHAKVNKITWALPTIHTLNQSHTYNELRAIEERLKEGTFRTITRPIERVDDSDARVRVLAGIPGIGPKKARVLLDHYGSVSAALGAVDTWTKDKVPGFGKIQVTKAKEVLE